MRVSLRISIFKSFYYFTSDFFPLFLLAPSYFAGHTTLGQLNKSRYAQGSVLGALSWFMGAYDTLTSFRATCTRLLEFLQAMEEASTWGEDKAQGFERKISAESQADALNFEGTVCLPTGKSLLEGVS